MKNKFLKLIFIVVMFLSFISLQDINQKVFAGEVYTSETIGHYKNPFDGSIEDPGNNPGIGEGMVSNVVSGLSLIEKDDDGKLYATVRYRLRSNITNVKIWVKDKNSNKYIQVPVKEVNTGDDTGDYRFEIPSTGALIKSSFYVTPMGREVIFYVTFGGLQPGSGDFKVFVNTSTSVSDNTVPSDNNNSNSERKNQSSEVQKKPENENKSLNTNKAVDTKTSTQNIKSANENKTESDKGKYGHGEGVVDKNSETEKNRGFDHGLLTNKDFEDNKSNAIKKEYKNGPVTNYFIVFLVVVLAIIFSVFVLGAIGVYVFYKYKKINNESLEDIIKGDEEDKYKYIIQCMNDKSSSTGNSSNLKKNDLDKTASKSETKSCDKLEKNEIYNSNKKVNEPKTKKTVWGSHPGLYNDNED